MGLLNMVFKGVLNKGIQYAYRKVSPKAYRDVHRSSGGLDLRTILQWIDQLGGFRILMQKLQQGGLGAVVGSWLGKGTNKPVNASQLHNAFSDGELKTLANKLGTNTRGAVSQLQSALPLLIDKASPDGIFKPENIGRVLKGIFGSK